MQETLDDKAEPREWRELEGETADERKVIPRFVGDRYTCLSRGEAGLQDPLGAVRSRMLYQLLTENAGDVFETLKLLSERYEVALS